MFVKKLRRRLFGYKKADVFALVTEIDTNAAEKVAEKESEIQELKNRVAVLEAERDAIAKAFMVAEEKANEVVEGAKAKADAMVKEAEEKIRAQKDAFEAETREKREAFDTEMRLKKEHLEQEIQIEKSNVNREIEVKRKAIKNYYVAENKKIDQIKSEVERMRMASMDAIRRFEEQLHEVERLSVNSSSYLESAMSFSQADSAIEAFSEVERNIPVHIIGSISER